MGPLGGCKLHPPFWAHGQVTPEGSNFGGCNFLTPILGPSGVTCPFFTFRTLTVSGPPLHQQIPNPPTACKPSHEAKERVHFSYAATTALHMIKQPTLTIIKPDGALPPPPPILHPDKIPTKKSKAQERRKGLANYSCGYFCMHSSASFCACYKFNLLRFA